MNKTKKKPIKAIVVKLKKEGAKCPNPSTGKALEFGKETTVPDAPYWHRRIRDGVVELVTKPAPEEKTPDKTSEKTDAKTK